MEDLGFFQGYRTFIVNYDDTTDPELIVLDGLYVWARISKVPDLYRHVSVVDR